MSQVSEISLVDLKASEISAMAQLSETMMKQAKAIPEIYKDITEIQLNLQKLRNPFASGNGNSEGGVVNNTQTNNYFSGTTDDLLKMINDNKK